jgi:hypothetical protein
MAFSQSLTKFAGGGDEDDDANTRTSFCSASGATLTSVVDEDKVEDILLTMFKNAKTIFVESVIILLTFEGERGNKFRDSG